LPDHQMGGGKADTARGTGDQGDLLRLVWHGQ
jgi:hypothetical protein